MTQRRRMKVLIRGQIFASVYEAAAHFKVSPYTVYHAIADGKTDRVGIGKGKRAEGSIKKRGGHLSIPVKLGPFTFPSIKEAGRELGFAEDYFPKLLREDTERSRQLIYAALFRYEAAQANKRKDYLTE
jgi:hypothetical protein